MKLQISISIILLISISISNAAILTVDRAPHAGQYKTLQEAHDAANDGDSIYVYPSTSSYNSITISKKIKFLGTGYSRSSDVVKPTLLTGRMIFNEGSDGSILEGFGGVFYVTIDANNIMIKRNLIYGITILANHKQNTILQNYIYNNTTNYLVTINENNEVFITNNKLWNMQSKASCSCGGGDFFGRGINASNPTITIILFHNVISTPCAHHNDSLALNLLGSNIDVQNNIIVNGKVSASTQYFNYNMSNANQLPNANGNIQNINMDTVFVKTGSDFHLLENSPAKGAGRNGVDMGIYGGSTPFVDNGIPTAPSIIQIEADHVASQKHGLDITIKAKSTNE